jgi:PPOX class probable F420-dependent enzyme
MNKLIEDRERHFIERQPVARLSTVDTGCRPHVIPIVFAFDGQRLFTPIDRKPKRAGVRKLRRVLNIQINPGVTVLLDEYHDDWSQLAWVQLRGQANFVESGSERDLGVSLLKAKYPQYEDQSLVGQPIIIITVEQVVSWRADSATYTPQG